MRCPKRGWKSNTQNLTFVSQQLRPRTSADNGLFPSADKVSPLLLNYIRPPRTSHHLGPGADIRGHLLEHAKSFFDQRVRCVIFGAFEANLENSAKLATLLKTAAQLLQSLEPHEPCHGAGKRPSKCHITQKTSNKQKKLSILTFHHVLYIHLLISP